MFRALLGLTVITTLILYPCLGQASHGAFPDVSGVLSGDILNAHNVGLVDGYPDGTFRPHTDVTRAAFAKMIVLAVEQATGQELPSGEEDFTDVTTEQALYPYVVKAYNAGYIQGYTNGTFGYDKKISRKEAAVILQRALKLSPADEDFADVPDDSWFAEAVGAVARAGIMEGFGFYTFRPEDNLLRGQAAAIAYRAYSYTKSKVSPPLGSQQNPAPIGTELSIGDEWRVQVIGVDEDAWPEISEASDFNDPPASGYQYVMARVRVTNVGTNTQNGIYLYFNYLDANNVLSRGSCGVIPDPLIGGPLELFPGSAVEGNVCWSVASNAVKGGNIVVSNWDDVRVYFQGVR